MAAPSRAPPAHTMTCAVRVAHGTRVPRDPASAEIGGRCDGGRRSAIGGADWKLSGTVRCRSRVSPVKASLLDRWPPLATSSESRTPKYSRPPTDPDCAMGTGSAAGSPAPQSQSYPSIGPTHDERFARNEHIDWSAYARSSQRHDARAALT